MDVQETSLPGVGERFDIPLSDGTYLCILVHNTGKREIYLKDDLESDGELLASLSDKEARVVGSVLEGAYFQPIKSNNVQALLDDDTLLEWVRIDKNSPLVGQTLGEANLRRESGASVIAIQRGDETIVSPEGIESLVADDTLIAVGDVESKEKLEELAASSDRD